MKDILKNLAELIKVKTIVTLIVVVVFAVLALNGTITADNVMIIISMVVSFYFGTQHEKKGGQAVSAAEESGAVVYAAPDTMRKGQTAVDEATYNKTHPDE